MDDKVYVPSSATDVMATWRKYGYVPPSEDPAYQERWDYYQSLPIRKETPHEAGQRTKGDESSLHGR